MGLSKFNGKTVANIVVKKVSGSGSSGTPIEISTSEAMEEALSEKNLGKIYLYTGETNDTYTNGHLYQVVDNEEDTPTIEDVSEGITIPQVSNIVLNENGTISFDAPNIEELEEYSPIISYIVNVNGNELVTSENTNVNVFSYLLNGTNSISVIVKAILTMSGDAKTASASYSMPETGIFEITTTLPVKLSGMAAISVDSVAYLFGGYSSDGQVKTIYKFDATTETITAMGDTLPEEKGSISSASINNIIYLFGGSDHNYRYDTICKYVPSV